MDCAYIDDDDDDKHSSRCYTSSSSRSSSFSSSSSSSSSSMEEEHYAIDKDDDDQIEEPGTPKPLPEVSSKSNQIPISNNDPNRIPSSVFAAKPSSAMEWSVASNESLFSIHVGNNSFSNKSGELGLTPLSPVTEKGSSNVVEFDHCSDDESVEETESIEAPEENKESRGVLSSSQSFQFPVLLDHHDQVKHILDQAMKEEKHEMMLAPRKHKSDPEFESPESTLVPLTATKTGSWISCFLCCWICQL